MDKAGEGAHSPPPADDGTRNLAVARPDDRELVHLAVVGDTYTVLFSGDETAGRFAMLDMLIPPGAGPPPHRHDFEECFRVIEGSVELRIRDLPPVTLEVGDSANIPANAPHSFRNAAELPARLLCTVVPSGLEKFFAEFGDRVQSRTSPPPKLSESERQARLQRAMEKAPQYGMEILPPRKRSGSLALPTARRRRRDGSNNPFTSKRGSENEGNALPRVRRA